MATSLARTPFATFDWQRVGALSTTLAAHAAVLALILTPFAAPPIERSLQRAIEVSFSDPQPPPPPPADHWPEPKTPRPPVTTKPVRPPQPATPPTATPTEAPNAPADVVAVDPAPPVTDIAPPAGPAAPAGETRQLAYDGTLRTRYPVQSIRAHEEGAVLLRVLVDAEGRVERVEIARSSGYPKLDAAAREAVQHGRFKPVLVAGKATPAWGLVPIEFRLDRA